MSLVLLCFCAFCAFFAFCASGIFSQKKINRFEMVLMTSITHTTESKVIPAAPKRLASYFCRPQTVKNSFRRNSVTYGTPCHAIRHFVFLLSPCFLQNAMPCHWLSSDLPHVLQIWESSFYSQAFFSLYAFLLVLRLPWESAVQPQC